MVVMILWLYSATVHFIEIACVGQIMKIEIKGGAGP